MPNTLAHLGINGVVTRTLLPNADLKWIYVGAIIPDFPWITQRIIKLTGFADNLYDLRLYCVIQATLFFCLVLSFALATLSRKFGRTFLILGFGSFLHLLTDALQIKWANGVNLLAPYDWQIWSFAFFWPESFVTYALTIFGLIYFFLNFKRAVNQPESVHWQWGMRHFSGICLLLIYFLLPVLMFDSPESADNHFVETLREAESRQGKYIEFDRVVYKHRPSGGFITSFAGEQIFVENIALEDDAYLSIRGIFLGKNRVWVEEYHRHYARLRDFASFFGLGLVTFLCGRYFFLVVKNGIKDGKKLPGDSF